jgi:hypothetical protein
MRFGVRRAGPDRPALCGSPLAVPGVKAGLTASHRAVGDHPNDIRAARANCPLYSVAKCIRRRTRRHHPIPGSRFTGCPWRCSRMKTWYCGGCFFPARLQRFQKVIVARNSTPATIIPSGASRDRDPRG